MDQQRSAILKILLMFRLSVTVPNLCPQPKSTLITCLINDHLLDKPSFINISQRILTDSSCSTAEIL